MHFYFFRCVYLLFETIRNVFLSKAFNHRAFYNAELGLFEEVAVPRKTSMEESVPQVVSPTSSCSLIVTDDNIIAVCNW